MGDNDVEVAATVNHPTSSKPMSLARYIATCLLLALVAGGIDWWRWAWHSDMVYSSLYIVGLLHYIITIGMLWRFAPGGELRCAATPDRAVFPATLVFILVTSFVFIHTIGLTIGVFVTDVETMSRTWPSFWTYSVGSLFSLLGVAFPLGPVVLIASECGE
jgi:hypothetical protein